MKNVSMILFAIMFLFIINCSGDDGKDGVAGLTGHGGCALDESWDKETQMCLHDEVKHEINHPKDSIVPGPKGKDFDPDTLAIYIVDHCEANPKSGEITCN